MCFLSEWKPGDWIALISLFVSILTLSLGYLAYDKLLNQEASKKQLEIVNSLITDLVYGFIQISQRNIPENISVPTLTYNVFGLASRKLYPPERNFEVIIADKFSESLLTRASKHLSNPLLPPVIAESVSALNDLTSVRHKDDSTIRPHFIIGRENINSFAAADMEWYISGGINALLLACKNVQSSLTDWYKEKGIKNINHLALRTDKQ